MGWEIWPNALRDALLLLTKRYGPVSYHGDHLFAVAEASAGGADVRSYHAAIVQLGLSKERMRERTYSARASASLVARPARKMARLGIALTSGDT